MNQNFSFSIHMTPTDALYGFVSWLTTRDEAVTFGAKHDASEASCVLQKYLTAARLPDVSEDYPDNLPDMIPDPHDITAY